MVLARTLTMQSHKPPGGRKMKVSAWRGWKSIPAIWKMKFKLFDWNRENENLGTEAFFRDWATSRSLWSQAEFVAKFVVGEFKKAFWWLQKHNFQFMSRNRMSFNMQNKRWFGHRNFQVTLLITVLNDFVHRTVKFEFVWRRKNFQIENIAKKVEIKNFNDPTIEKIISSSNTDFETFTVVMKAALLVKETSKQGTLYKERSSFVACFI